MKDWECAGGVIVEVQRKWTLLPERRVSAGRCQNPRPEKTRVEAVKRYQELKQLPETSACLLLCFATGPGLGAAAATSRSWAQVARHPELWCWLCTRASCPLVHPGAPQLPCLQRKDQSFLQPPWQALARSTKDAVVRGWAGAVPAADLTGLVQAIRRKPCEWLGLSTLHGQQSHGSAGSSIASPFLKCEKLFPLSGGFALSFEEPPQAVQPDGEPQFWVRISAPPLGPVCLRMLLLCRCEPDESPEVVDLRLELRADVGLGRRLDGFAEHSVLETMRQSVRRGTLHAIILATEPDFDTEGHPGGSGWIPWSPAHPKANFFQLDNQGVSCLDFRA